MPSEPDAAAARASEQLTIPARFRGPPESANGGYAAGLLAAFVHSPAVEVTLRLPPPLERPLTVAREGTRVLLLDGDDTVAEAEATTLSVTPPVRPTAAEAEAAARGYVGFETHPFPT